MTMKHSLSYDTSNNPRRVNFTPSAHASLNDLIVAKKRSFGYDDLYSGVGRKSSVSPTGRQKSDTYSFNSRPISLKARAISTGSLRSGALSRPATASGSSFRTTSSSYPAEISVPMEQSFSPTNDYEAYWLGGKTSSTRITPTAITTLRGGGNSRGGNSRGGNSHDGSSTTERRSFNQLMMMKSLQFRKDPLMQSNQALPVIHYSSLGDIYSNSNAMKAYKAKQLASKNVESPKKLRLIFLNQTSRPLILCWVGFDHKLHHYYRLKPCNSTIIIGGVDHSSEHLDTRLDGGLHTEHSYLGHTFILGMSPENDDSNEEDNTKGNGYHYYDDDDDDDKYKFQPFWMPFKQHEEDENTKLDKSKIRSVIGAYRPMHLGLNNKEEHELKEEYCVHLITITEELAFLPNAKIPSIPQIVFHLSVRQCEIDSTPLDTRAKEYTDITMGGWKVMCEKGLFASNISSLGKDVKMEEFKQRFEADLCAAKDKLPSHAYKLLKKTTPFWVNKTQYYGPKAAPIRGHGMCFHPEKQWLFENGMSERKCRGIELYEAQGYLEDCNLWHGQGGVLIHELSHA